MNYYPNNTLTAFQTHFESPLLLSEDHEAALSEIILPTEWSNVLDDDSVTIVSLCTEAAVKEADEQLKPQSESTENSDEENDNDPPEKKKNLLLT